MNIEQAVKKSIHNHAEIAAGVDCGCYFCLTIFDGGTVYEWTDEGTTAVCPRCGIDSVLSGITDMEYLKSAHERWFTSTK
jgi:hypothetical protein